MDELRNIILTHLDALRSSGLLEARYELYIDAVYRCESWDELLELAALELQMEASEFLEQLAIEADKYNSAADEFAEVARLNSAGFGDENTDLDATLSMSMTGTLSGGVLDDSSAVSTDVAGDDFVADPELLALQQALFGNTSTPENDPDFFDIDALLSGGIPPQPATVEHSTEYKDALAELLAAYPVTEEEDVDEEGVLVSNGENVVSMFPQHGLETSTGFVSPGFPQAGFGAKHPESSGFPKTDALDFMQNQGERRQTQMQQPRAVKATQIRPSVQSDIKDIFSGFSKRKKTNSTM